MRTSYGLSYAGSKNKIFYPLVTQGICLYVDLFGGGGAISHYLSIHGAAPVIYNDKNISCVLAFFASVHGLFGDLSRYSMPFVERKKLARIPGICDFLYSFYPARYHGVCRDGRDVERRWRRFKHVSDTCLKNIEFFAADYSAFSFLKRRPDVAWYIDPPYAGVMNYDTSADWSWNWCDDIEGPVIGFDTFVPAGMREVSHRLGRVFGGSRYRKYKPYNEFCFVNTKVHTYDIAEQLDLI